jgi:hypothetical protein
MLSPPGQYVRDPLACVAVAVWILSVRHFVVCLLII